MTSSAPFPGESSLAELANPDHGIFIKLEDGHVRGMVPSFYRDHPNAGEIVVKADGVPLESCGKQFVVAQIPIERRWAVLLDGEVMGELEFRKCHVMWYEEYFRELARENPDLQSVDGGRPDYDIPDPRRFVAVQVDPTTPHRFVPVNYEPHRTAGARSKEFFTREGEVVDGSRLQVLCNAYADPKMKSRLTVSEIEEVESSLGISGRGGSEIATKLELLNSMKAAGDLTSEQHSKQVALLTGAPAPSLEPVAAEPVAVEPNATHTEGARCGKQFTKETQQGVGAAVRLHERNCSACKEASD